MRNLPNIYSSYCPGTPAMNGVPGSLLEVYKACLVNGTSKVSFNNIVVANGVATIKAVVEGQVYFNGSRITIEGCDEPLLNGTVEVSAHNLTTFSFKTTVADGTYGGAIKINQPGAGWQILFSGTNEAVFISGNLDSLGVCLKIIDTNAYQATVEVYENMTSLTAGINRLNWETMYDSGRHYRICKSGYANAVAQHYWLAADNTNCHISIDRQDSSTLSVAFENFVGGPIMSWGQFESFAEADKKNFFITGLCGYVSSGNGNYNSTYNYNIGWYANTTPTDSYLHMAILTNSLKGIRGWMKGYVSAQPAPFLNNSQASGALVGNRLSYKLKPNFLTTDYLITGHGPSRGTMIDPLLMGYIKETKFYNVAAYGALRNFSIDEINGKRYINLPTLYYYTTRSSNTAPQAQLGLIPMLVGEKWGD